VFGADAKVLGFVVNGAGANCGLVFGSNNDCALLRNGPCSDSLAILAVGTSVAAGV
jgi:hypothetical protein